MTRKHYLLLGAILSLPLITLFAWTQATRLSGSLIAGAARSLGLRDITVSVSGVSPQQIDIPHISFTYALEDSIASVSIKGLIARYDIRSLLDGRVHTTTADHAEIVLASRSGRAERPVLATVTNLLAELDLDIASLLPLDAATITDYQLKSDILSDKVSGSFRLERQPEAINGTLIARWRGARPVRLDMVTTGPGHWTVLMTEDAARREFLSLSLSGTDQLTDIMAHLDLGATPVGILPTVIEGIIHVSGRFQLPEAGDTTMEVALNADSELIDGGSYALEDVDISIKGKVISDTNSAMLLESETTLFEIGSLKAGKVSVERADIATTARIEWGDYLSVELLPGSTLKVDKVLFDDIARIDGLSSTFSGALEDARNLLVTMNGDSTMSTDSLRIMASRWPEGLEVSLAEDLTVEYLNGYLRLVSPATFTSPGFLVEHKDYRGATGAVVARLNALETDDENPLASAELQAGTLALGRAEPLLDLRDIEQDVNYLGGVVSAKGTFTDNVRNLTLASTLAHDIAGGEGEGEVQTTTLILSADTPLASYIQPVDLPLSAITGTIEARLAAHWNIVDDYGVRASLSMKANALGGAYENLYFSGLSTALNTQLLPNIQTTNTLQLNIADIDAGLPVTNLLAQYRLSGSAHGPLPVVELPLLEATVLGGEIFLSDSLFDPNLEENNLVVGVKGISLGDTVALHQMKDIVATGLIDGSLPISLSADGLSVRSGLLYAREPGGRIAYSADTSGLENAAPGTDIVFNALKNFNYTSLRAEPDYDSSGLLVLGLNLEGSNPDLEGGRPIILNVTLEQNVIQLLQSLRFVDGLNDAIDSRVRDYYQGLN